MIIILLFLVGLIFGSFITAVSYRLPDLEKIISGRSHCPECKKTLGFWDLIPLLSFIFLAGKCRYCGNKISIRYPIIEIITGILFVLVYLKFGFTIQAVVFWLIAIGMQIIVFYDFDKMIIPDEIIYPTAIIALIYIVYLSFANSFSNLSSSLIGAAIFGSVLLAIYLLSKGKWMGFGDIKLAFLIGFILGYPHTFTAFLLTFLIGGFVGVILMAIGKKHLKDKVPLAPFMILGFWITLFWGEKLFNWYLNISL